MVWPSWPPSVSMARLWHSCSKGGARTRRRTKVKGANAALPRAISEGAWEAGPATPLRRFHGIRYQVKDVARAVAKTNCEPQEPGGWNRVVLKVYDLPGLIAEFKQAGVGFATTWKPVLLVGRSKSRILKGTPSSSSN